MSATLKLGKPALHCRTHKDKEKLSSPEKQTASRGHLYTRELEEEITLTFEMILWIIKLQLSVVKSGKRK